MEERIFPKFAVGETVGIDKAKYNEKDYRSYSVEYSYNKYVVKEVLSQEQIKEMYSGDRENDEYVYRLSVGMARESIMVEVIPPKEFSLEWLLEKAEEDLTVLKKGGVFPSGKEGQFVLTTIDYIIEMESRITKIKELILEGGNK